MAALGERMKAERQKRNWTQQQLADAAAMPRESIALLETRDRSPRYETVERLARAFGITVDELVNGPPIDTTDPPLEVLGLIWPPEDVAQLAALWPELPEDRRRYWWERARLWESKRAQLAEAKEVIAALEHDHRVLDALDAQPTGPAPLDTPPNGRSGPPTTTPVDVPAPPATRPRGGRGPSR